jgi:hypothetical protein
VSELDTPSTQQIRRTDRLVGSYLVFVAVRCTIQYVLVPFVLPFFGLGGTLSTAVAIAIDLLALGMIAFNIWRLWGTSWRWRYLALSAVMITILVIFLYNDLRALAAL